MEVQQNRSASGGKAARLWFSVTSTLKFRNGSPKLAELFNQTEVAQLSVCLAHHFYVLGERIRQTFLRGTFCWSVVCQQMQETTYSSKLSRVRKTKIHQNREFRLPLFYPFDFYLYLCLPDRCGQKIHKSKGDRQCKIGQKENVRLFCSYVLSVRTVQTDRGINAPLHVTRGFLRKIHGFIHEVKYVF